MFVAVTSNESPDPESLVRFRKQARADTEPPGHVTDHSTEEEVRWRNELAKADYSYHNIFGWSGGVAAHSIGNLGGEPLASSTQPRSLRLGSYIRIARDRIAKTLSLQCRDPSEGEGGGGGGGERKGERTVTDQPPYRGF